MGWQHPLTKKFLERVDNEFAGAKLDEFVIDLQAVVGKHHAGMTPLGSAVMELSQKASDNDRGEPE